MPSADKAMLPSKCVHFVLSKAVKPKRGNQISSLSRQKKMTASQKTEFNSQLRSITLSHPTLSNNSHATQVPFRRLGRHCNEYYTSCKPFLQ
jgi:hypothetical protein